MTKILIADDERGIRQSIRLILSSEDYEIIEAESLEQTRQKIEAELPELIVLDVHFKGEGTSHVLLRQLIEKGIQIPVIVLSGAATAREAAEAIQLGAYDFIEKPVTAERLRLTIARCLEAHSLKHSLQRLTTANHNTVEFLGKSAEASRIRRQIGQFAKKDVKVLITGETGVGKEVVAQSLWQSSERSNQSFIIVNSAAIPENLIESELFGHKKGSFTGAISDQLGKIEMADRGTLFLDEVGDLTPAAQTKLLRFLESGEIQKVGSNQIRRVDVRLVAATSRDLESEMAKGHFRADLYYRLNVARIAIAPLRERPEDIGLLFVHFVDGFCRKFKEKPRIISPEVLEKLTRHSWPGNIRELRNVAERVVLASEERILLEHLWQVLPSMAASAVQSKGEKILALKDFKAESERRHIQEVLALAGGSITEAAKLLKIDRTYLHQKMNHHGIESRKRFEREPEA